MDVGPDFIITTRRMINLSERVGRWVAGVLKGRSK